MREHLHIISVNAKILICLFFKLHFFFHRPLLLIWTVNTHIHFNYSPSVISFWLFRVTKLQSGRGCFYGNWQKTRRYWLKWHLLCNNDLSEGFSLLLSFKISCLCRGSAVQAGLIAVTHTMLMINTDCTNPQVQRDAHYLWPPTLESDGKLK